VERAHLVKALLRKGVRLARLAAVDLSFSAGQANVVYDGTKLRQFFQGIPGLRPDILESLKHLSSDRIRVLRGKKLVATSSAFARVIGSPFSAVSVARRFAFAASCMD